MRGSIELVPPDCYVAAGPMVPLSHAADAGDGGAATCTTPETVKMA